MKIVATGDWHGHLPQDFPDGDVLVVAGDTSKRGDHSLDVQFKWLRDHLGPHLARLPFNDIVLIAGNHDYFFQHDPDFARSLMPPNVRYLCDQAVRINGVKFWGSPWSNKFCDWSFMREEAQLVECWARIPENTDVLVVHGPPFGACDKTTNGQHVGSSSLRERIVALRIPLVITGHIHEAQGSDQIGLSRIENVSYVDRRYEPANLPRVVEVRARFEGRKLSWVGGRRAIHAPEHPRANSSGYIQLSRFLMEAHLGRRLEEWEEVHHVNEDPLDDRVENYEVLTTADHARRHMNVGRRRLDYSLLRELHDSGLGYKRIAKATGYPRSSIRDALRRDKIEREHQGA